MAETACEIPSDVPPALSDSPDAIAEKALRNVVTTALSSGRSLDDPGVRGLLRRQLAQWRQCFSRHGSGPSDGQKTAELLSGLVDAVDPADPGKPHPRALATALSSGLPSLRTLPSGLFQGRVGRALLEGIGRAHPRALAYAPAEVRTDPNFAEVFRARVSAPPTASEQALNKLGLSQEQTTAIAIGATDTSHGSQQMAEKLAETLKEAVGASGGEDGKAAKTVKAAVALVSAEIGQKKQEAVAEIVQASKEGADGTLDVLRKSGYATAEGKPRFDRIHADVMKIALARAAREAEARGEGADPSKKPAVTDEIFDASVDEFLDASGLGGGGGARDPLRAAILLHAREKTVAAVMGSRAVTSYVAGKTSAEQMRKAVENAETAKLQDGVKLPAEFPFSRGPME